MKRSLFISLLLFSLTFMMAASKNSIPRSGVMKKEAQQPSLRSRLYPNPTRDLTYVKNTSNSRIKNISILSMVGSSLISKDVEDDNIEQEVNVSKLPAGRYFVKVFYIDGNLEILSLIKI